MPGQSCDDAVMPLQPGAEPYHHDGGPVGAVLCHGFTSTPASMRPWAEHLAGEGLSVALPRLPGHGTTWQEANVTRWQDWYAEVDRAFRDLSSRCDQVFVMGLSMGATLSLRLAQEHGGAVSGIVVVNPSLLTRNKLRHVARFVPLVTKSIPAIANDIKKPGVTEQAYDRTPTRAMLSLTQLWLTVRTDLDKVTQPVLLFRSAQDHVVEPDSSHLLQQKISSREVREVVLEDSYHVATLDNDAPTIFAGSVEFVRQHAGARS
jgi:carboxylesterase